MLKNTITIFACLAALGANARSLTINKDKTIEYHHKENGDRIPDFSFCGYNNSESAIPHVPVKIILSPAEGDMTHTLQSAIDALSAMEQGKDGFRGAILLEEGDYRIDGSLLIGASGVVIRGSGYGQDGTRLIATGTDRRTLVRVAGKNDLRTSDTLKVSQSYVPLNATVIPFEGSHKLKKGDKILVCRPSTKEWISSIGADQIGQYVDYKLTHWEPGNFDIRWQRTVAEVRPGELVLDIPLTNSLDPRYGQSYILPYKWDGRISNVGIENLSLQSEYDHSNDKDENHSWMGIAVENASNGWIRRVSGHNFVSSVVALWESVSKFTVEDCKSLNPVGEIGAFRRMSFQNSGQQNLMQRCYAEYGWHDFSVGLTAAGPNAFVQCYSYQPYNFSGTLGGWSTGTLFDRVTVDGGSLMISYRDIDGQGGGWSGANSLCWQPRVGQIHLQTPPDAYNWSFGNIGQGYGDGSYEMPRVFLSPQSLYYAQLKSRTGRKSEEEKKIYYLVNMPIAKTTPDYTRQMSERSRMPELTIDGWIDTIAFRYPVSLDASGAISNWKQPAKARGAAKNARQVEIANGRIVSNGGMLNGRIQRTALWQGNLRPQRVASEKSHLTRFVPGREGRGYTDILDSVVARMQADSVVALNHFPALWYERRRDDHSRGRRADADVWAPFYEQPFSRSGQGEANDRLSKYDLDKFNPWYWGRLKQFADMADNNGIILIADHYLQHNIIEEGAHWADYPWRSGNNINNIGFAENTYYAGDKRVFMADEFYDVTNPVRKGYHSKYIRKHLDDLGDNPNTIHHLGLEYTGPASFVRFWLDEIMAWEQQTGKPQKVMLSATKDVTDSIMSDPHYAAAVDIIDIRQWHYREDGSLYAPEGGVSLAQRQYRRIIDPGNLSLDGIYHLITDYTVAYPDKVVVNNVARGADRNWVSLASGASLNDIPFVDHPRFASHVASMPVNPELTIASRQWGMGSRNTGYLIFTLDGNVDLPEGIDSKRLTAQWIDPATGKLIGKPQRVSSSQRTFRSPTEGKVVLWLMK